MRSRASLMLSAAVTAATMGCNVVTGPLTNTYLRSINASPNRPPFDISVYGSQIVTGLPYATATTYLSEPPGSFEIVVTSAGSKTIVLDDSLETVPGGTVRTSIALDHPGGGAPLTALNLANAG